MFQYQLLYSIIKTLKLWSSLPECRQIRLAVWLQSNSADFPLKLGSIFNNNSLFNKDVQNFSRNSNNFGSEIPNLSPELRGQHLPRQHLQ